MIIKTTKVFFDTNVLVYAVTEDDARSSQAEALLAAGGVISMQILNEFASVARRKLSMSWPDGRRSPRGDSGSLSNPNSDYTGNSSSSTGDRGEVRLRNL